MKGSRGFTLLEVLVAIAILGLGLTAILSAQAGAFASATHARNLSVATGLLRCKMMEVEEHLSRDGFQETDETGAGPCCDGEDTPNMKCTWRVDKPTFPDAKFGDLNLSSALGGSGTPGSPGGAFGALGLLSAAGGSSSPLAGATNVTDVAKTLADANQSVLAGAAVPGASMDPNASATDPGAAGMGGITSMAMSIVYPSLKILFEASTRRIVSTLTFREGSKEYNVEVTEWYTIPQKGLSADDTTTDDTSAAPSATSTSKSAPTKTTGSK